MTAGAVLQLVAYGAQDVYLINNPQITFFKQIYRRHSNFSMEWVAQREMTSSGHFGNRMEILIDRVGDLLGSMHLEIAVPPLMQVQPGLNESGQLTNSTWVGFCNSFMHALVESVEIQIGGQIIDRQYGDWLEIWSEIALDESKQFGYRQMIGKWNTDVSLQTNARPESCKDLYRFRLPLQFWFNRHPGLYLPLIALQYHEVRIIFNLRPATALIKSDVYITNPLAADGSPWNARELTLWSNYIYLDTDERRKFVQNTHEYLIEQLQFNTAQNIPDRVDTYTTQMEFNHPIKELMWVIPDEQPCEATGNSLIGNNYFKYSPNNQDTFGTAKISFNGSDRFDAKYAEYFRNAQTFEHHIRIPRKFIYVYSFAIKPEEIQPSGSCNASRIDDFRINFTFGADGCCINDNRQLRIYARNYNVLRVMSGQGGLAFSN